MHQILLPGVSVDKVRAHLPKKHTEAIFGHYEGPERPIVPPYQWLNVGTGKIGVCSYKTRYSQQKKYVTLELNPSQIENGHNLFQYADPVQLALEDALRLVRRRIPQLKSRGYDLERWDSILRHAGHYRLSVLHLCADWVFPSWYKLAQCLGQLKRRWTWSRNRRKNDHFDTSLYFNQSAWDVLIYSKEDEIEAHYPHWPAPLRALAKQRLRFELRLKNYELKTLGKRVQRNSNRPRLLRDYGLVGIWEEPHFQRIFDLYARRLKPRGYPYPPIDAVPMIYRLFANYGAVPVWKRD